MTENRKSQWLSLCLTGDQKLQGGYNSRVVEIEALNNVLRQQLDKASDAEQAAVREVRRELDRSVDELTRAQDRNQEMAVKEEALNARIKQQEKEIIKVIIIIIIISYCYYYYYYY